MLISGKGRLNGKATEVCGSATSFFSPRGMHCGVRYLHKPFVFDNLLCLFHPCQIPRNVSHHPPSLPQRNLLSPNSILCPLECSLSPSLLSLSLSLHSITRTIHPPPLPTPEDHHRAQRKRRTDTTHITRWTKSSIPHKLSKSLANSPNRLSCVGLTTAIERGRNVRPCRLTSLQEEKIKDESDGSVWEIVSQS